ncbi:hypothetical protein SEA_HUBBS_93 [Microbacterium phage Hubbs]|nr:hypothetical protein SEA_HUBBS_93 [Microbacterium phage Hubbs]
MSRAEELAESLSSIQDAIDDIKEAISEANGAREHQELLDVKVDLLRDRQAVVEQLEALGLEDPAS